MTATANGYVTVIWEARARPGKEADLKAFIADAVTPSRHDAGNIDYEGHEVEGEPGVFVIYERWESREYLQAHLTAPRVLALGPQMLALIEPLGANNGVRVLRPFRPESS